MKTKWPKYAKLVVETERLNGQMRARAVFRMPWTTRQMATVDMHGKTDTPYMKEHVFLRQRRGLNGAPMDEIEISITLKPGTMWKGEVKVVECNAHGGEP